MELKNIIETILFAAEKPLTLKELRETGNYKGMTEAEYVAARQEVEDLINLDEYYAIEAQTVETRRKQ